MLFALNPRKPPELEPSPFRDDLVLRDLVVGGPPSPYEGMPPYAEELWVIRPDANESGV